MTTKAEFEQAVLDSFYRTERWWASSACWLSSAGAIMGIVSGEYRAAAIALLVMSIGCQLVSWRAMRGAERLEKKRIERLESVRERWKGDT
jgi:hypothetical protein